MFVVEDSSTEPRYQNQPAVATCRLNSDIAVAPVATAAKPNVTQFAHKSLQERTRRERERMENDNA